MNSAMILSWLASHKKIAIKALLSLLVGLLVVFSINIYKQNKRLSKSLEMAQNNIEAYLGILNGSLLANNVLKLDMSLLRNTNDSLIQKIDSVRLLLKIKPKVIKTTATQTQTIYVTANKGVRGLDIIKTILRDTVYKDTIQFNPLTKVSYTIGLDTVNVKLDIKNLLFLYVYKKRLYKNKKNFIKRLFTLDFKKIDIYKYLIVNTNDIIKTSNVRVIEAIDK
ncbi:hypothetical protein [uncultured phage cr61_1]|uniref:Uncharacterized protein n=1 Tax=uncultured phage cr61_1 TaxID=2986417 RepID=A0AAE7S1T3_9CAUD|nr:hypothetical protein OJM08_gp20 [uncultured phage cr61_1]QWM90622.1 hypothetical protein [uncultured phage cr61_1]